MRFRLAYAVPPGGGWFCETPKGAFVESKRSLDDCIYLVRQAFAKEESPLPDDVSAYVQDFMCKHLPEGFCDGKPSVLHPRYFEILEATTKMVQASEAAGDYGGFPMQVLEARGSACARCPMHDMSICVTCNGLLAAFSGHKISRRTPYDRSLRVCRACAGLLPIMMHVHAKHVHMNAEPPDTCWVKKELANV